MKEIWKDIKGYEGLYQVSDLGNVKSLLRDVHIKGIKYRQQKEKIISQRKSGAGYFQSMLCKNGEKKYILTHRLIAEAFIHNPENKPQVNHINGIKTDNRVENLEWCTQSENQIHAIINGLQPYANGEKRGNVCKLKWVQVQEIKALLKMGVSNKLIAKHYCVNPVTISNIKTGAIWKD